MAAHRRRLTAIDDPLPDKLESRSTPEPDRRRQRRDNEDASALYAVVPAVVARELERAAFELRAQKRDLIGALIWHHVDARSERGLADLRALVAAYREEYAD